MAEILTQLGIAPHQYACMHDMEAIDISALAPLTAFPRNNPQGFCAQIDVIIEQALCVINGYYGEVERRPIWRFWTPIMSLRETVAEITFSIGKDSDGVATYVLCFHGDIDSDVLARYSLFSQVNDPLPHMNGAYHCAHSLIHDDDEGSAGRFTLSIKGSTDHTLELCLNTE